MSVDSSVACFGGRAAGKAAGKTRGGEVSTFQTNGCQQRPASLRVRIRKSRMDEEQRMCKNIIHIFGASGSGTTTLGRKICSELGYCFMDTDDYFWLPTNPKYTTKRDKKEREREKFGKRIEFGGDMFEIHQAFIAWARSYDNGDINMRSKAKHDAWQKLLSCKLIRLNGANDLQSNFIIVRKNLEQ